MAATNNGDDTPNTPPEKIWCIIGDLQYGTRKTQRKDIEEALRKK